MAGVELDTFGLRFADVDHGWLNVEVVVGSVTATLEASYVDDAPRVLVDAATRVLLGDSPTRFSWVYEPGRFHWEIDRQDRDQVRVRVWRQEDLLNVRRPYASELLRCATTPTQFARAVLRAVDRVGHDLGEEGFAARWQRPFPGDALERLRSTFREMRS